MLQNNRSSNRRINRTRTSRRARTSRTPRRPSPDLMETIEKSIEVDAPVSAVYNQWTQFEEFPQFMSDVQEVRQLDDRHLHWVASIGGKKREWDAEIIEQVPDDRIAWRSTSGP